MDLLANVFVGRERFDNSNDDMKQIILYCSYMIGETMLVSTVVLLTPLYTEIAGLDIGIIATLEGGTDAVTMVLASAIGFLSDSCESSWGRRKPFVVVGTILMLVGALLAAHPSLTSAKAASSSPFANHTTPPLICALSTCDLIKNCIKENLLDSRPKNQSRQPQTEEIPALVSPVWFFVWTLTFKVGFCTALSPYIAMGQELTSDPTRRLLLFSYKGMCKYAGIMTYLSLSLYLANQYANDYAYQMHIFSAAALVVAIPCLYLVSMVNTHFGGVSSVNDANIVAEFRVSILNNNIYHLYGSMRALFHFAYVMPILQLASYLKYLLHVENFALASLIFQVVMLMVIVLGTSCFKAVVERYGFRNYTMGAAVLGALSLAECFNQSSGLDTRIFMFGIAASIAPAKFCFFSVIDNYLSVVLDYDQLYTGKRHGGVFAAADQVLRSVMQTFMIAMSGSLLSAGGYIGNGGCECGCGKKCEVPYMRWNCLDDVGYACRGTLSDANMLFFGNAFRSPPCTQQTVPVTKLILMLFSFVPMLAYVGVLLLAMTFPITDRAHQEIHEQFT